MVIFCMKTNLEFSEQQRKSTIQSILTTTGAIQSTTKEKDFDESGLL